MIKAAHAFLLLFTAVLAETWVGSYGVVVPLTPMTVFYLAVLRGWRVGLALGIVAGVAVDAVYGRELYLSPLSLAAVAVCAGFWHHRGYSRSLRFQCVPGAVMSLLYIAFPTLADCLQNTPGAAGWIEAAATLLFATALGAALFPVMVVGLDIFNSMFKLDEYLSAWKKLMERS